MTELHFPMTMTGFWRHVSTLLQLVYNAHMVFGPVAALAHHWRGVLQLLLSLRAEQGLPRPPS